MVIVHFHKRFFLLVSKKIKKEEENERESKKKEDEDGDGEIERERERGAWLLLRSPSFSLLLS